MTRLFVLVRRLPGFAAAAAFALLAGVAVALIDPFAHRQALDDERLDALRGGYESAQGLVYSFGIERAVVVNGELIATTKLVIDNLGALLAGQPANVQIISQAQNVAQGTLSGVSPPAPSQTPPSAPPATPAPVTSTPPAAPASVPVASGPVGTPTQPQGTAAGPAASAAPVASTGAPPASAAPPQNTSSPPVAVAAPSNGNAGATPAAVATGPAAAIPAATTPVPTAPAAAAPAAGNSPVASAPPAAEPVTTAAPAAIPLFIQVNAAGQVILVPNGAAIAAGVQNQANNTTIATLTQYKAGVLADAAKQASFAKP